MIKNLVVNLSTGKDEDGARDYAVSLARELDAHLAAVAFAYEPIPAATLIDVAPGEWLDELRQEAEEAANAAIERFNAAVRGSGILAEARALTTTMAGAADLFGRIARRFDLAVGPKSRPHLPHERQMEGSVMRDETVNQMLEALKSAQRYFRANLASTPADLIAQIDAAIRRADAEQRGRLTTED